MSLHITGMVYFNPDGMQIRCDCGAVFVSCGASCTVVICPNCRIKEVRHRIITHTFSEWREVGKAAVEEDYQKAIDSLRETGSVNIEDTIRVAAAHDCDPVELAKKIRAGDNFWPPDNRNIPNMNSKADRDVMNGIIREWWRDEEEE